MTSAIKCLFLLGLSVMTFFKVVAQPDPNKVIFQTSKGLTIKVDTSGIYVNNKLQFKFVERYELILPSKRQKLIENGGVVFLFLEMSGSPNLDRFHVFKVSGNKVDLILDALSSDIGDRDGDGYLEFGGRDLTEMHPSEDSMYYIPTEYFEIRNGRITYDSILSKDMDIQINGVYLSAYGDDNGNCCKAILKPGKKKVNNVPLVHPFILSERTDGPANVRDTIMGKVLFSLYDNVPVYTSDTTNKWYNIALKVYLRESQFQSRVIPKDALLWSGEREVGKAISDIRLDESDMEHQGEKFTSVLRGYTSVQNIKPLTLPENALCHLMEQNADLTTVSLHDLILGYKFTRGKLAEYITYQLDDVYVDGSSSLLRLLLVFNKDKLIAVVHLRKLGQLQVQPILLKRGYKLSVIGDQPATLIRDLRDKFNSFINLAD